MKLTAQRQMILWTFIAVVAMSFATVSSLLTPPEKTLAVSARVPASVSSPSFESLAIDDKGTQALDYRLPCEDNARIPANVAQIRLRGTLCQKRKSIASSEITNITNGFSATVFPVKSDEFATDYMTLVPGENRIHIQHMLKSGERVNREFVLQRN